ncbi:unnamed protein product [Brachionus calyciflorus]|uniref:Endosome-associated-trafficking regulator 1 n=1 Tax=Brachionus calyciflorus TaxID=104777 RepID=A0A813MCW6_9BILA|nr:unnamed protein product [Brachionus calyciflorus]
MNESSDDEVKLLKKNQLNPFSFKNFQSPKETDIPTIDLPPIGDYDSSSSQSNPFSFKGFVQTEPDIDLPDISSELPEPPGLNSLSVNDLPCEIDIYDPTSLPAINDDTENLKEELNFSKETIYKQQNKIAKLEKRLTELEKKEESEAKTLELLVQQVENNLEKATARAIEAERKVELLKQELSQMKSQMNQLKTENLVLKNGNANNRNLFLKINGIASELNGAAFSAEKSLSFLSKGVESLKIIASNLESLEKLSEVFD